MDKKRLVIVLLLSAAVVIGWRLLVGYLGLDQQTQTAQKPPTTAPATTTSATAPSTLPVAIEATSQPAVAAQPTGLRVVAPGPHEFARLGYFAFDPDGKQNYPLGLKLSPCGASIKEAVLNRFERAVGQKAGYTFQMPYEGNVQTWFRCPLAARSIRVAGQWLDLSGVAWSYEREQSSDTKAVYSAKVRDHDTKLLTIYKTWQIKPKTDPGEGYAVDLAYKLVNHTRIDLDVQLTFNGPNAPIVENTRNVPEVVIGQANDGKVNMAHAPGTSYHEFAWDPLKKKQPLLWAGITSAYFEAIVRLPVKDNKPQVISDISAQPAQTRREDRPAALSADVRDRSDHDQGRQAAGIHA